MSTLEREQHKKEFRTIFLKNVIFVSIPVLIMFVMLFSLFYYFQRANNMQIAAQIENVSFERRVSEYNRFLSELNGLANELSAKDEIIQFSLSENLFENQQVFRTYVKTLSDFSKTLKLNNSSIEFVGVYSENCGYFMKSGGSPALTDEYVYKKIAETKDASGIIFDVYNREGSSMNKRIIFIKRIAFNEKTNITVFVSLYFNEFIEKIGGFDSNVAGISVSGGDGSVIFDNINFEAKEENCLINSAVLENKTVFTCRTDISDAVSVSKCISVNMIAWILIILAVTILLTFFIGKKLITPYLKINDILTNSQSGDKKGGEQYDFVLKSIKNIVESKYFLEEKIVTQYEQMKKMQNIALQEQIKPHFIFNTLQVIGLYADELMPEENKVSYMIEKMSEMLRYSMRSDSAVTTVGEELTYLKNYVLFQQENYYEKFDIEYNIPQDMLKYHIIRIVFQPIVENAIIYGIKPSDKKCHIDFNAREKDGCLIFEIINDGIPITRERAAELTETLEKGNFKNGNHIGLNNVNNRIKIMYGKEYGIRVYLSKSGKTVVKIRIPKMTI